MAKIAPRSEFLQLEGIQLDSLCRLCGNMNINLIPVIAEDGQETELLQKIVTHLKISVNPEDVLPKKLCIHCTNTLVSWHSFYESCRETNEKFHAMISCAKNGGIVEVAEDLQPEVLPEDGEEAEMDEYIEFLDKEDCEDENVDLLNEEEEHLLPGEEDLGDARCSKDPHGEENLKKSPLYDEDFVLIDTQGALENEAVKLEICDLAVESEPEEAPRPELVEKNLFIRRSGQFICPQCPKSFRVKKEFVQHLVEEHEFSENVKNGVKIRPEIDPEDVKRAEVEEDGRLMYKCSECGKILKSLDTFVWHRQIHTGVKMFSCHLCKKTFRIQQGLNRHIRELIQMDVQEVQEVQEDVCMEEVIKEELPEEDFEAKEGSEEEEIPGMEAPEECNAQERKFSGKKAQRKEKLQEEKKTQGRKRLRREFEHEKSTKENLPEGEIPGEASEGKTQEENVQEEKLSKIIKIERDLNEDLLPEGEFHEELNEQDHPEEEFLEDDERPEEQINEILKEPQDLVEEESQESPEKKFNQVQGLSEVEFQEEEEEEDLSVKEFSEEDAKNAPGSKFLEFPELPKRELKPATKSRENKSNDAFLCEMCHQIFTREYNLMKHITTHTEDHPCCVCCLSFPTNSALKAHGKNHTREEVREAENCRWVIKCESCSEKFTSTYHLYRHERSSHDTGKMYPCSQCHEVLPSGTLLRIHERRHQVFPCEIFLV
uniref:Uncharacterized protein n=2 Tax=Lutzomyia longipalpis TaxID=7200 RepID=A0A1B0CWB1_LUTLO